MRKCSRRALIVLALCIALMLPACRFVRPGELTGGRTGGVLFVRGQEPRRVEGDLAEQLIREVKKMIGEK